MKEILLTEKDMVFLVLLYFHGLTQESPALNRFCLAPPLLRNLSQEFLLHNSIVRSNHSYHYQWTGSKMIGYI